MTCCRAWPTCRITACRCLGDSSEGCFACQLADVKHPRSMGSLDVSAHLCRSHELRHLCAATCCSCSGIWAARCSASSCASMRRTTPTRWEVNASWHHHVHEAGRHTRLTRQNRVHTTRGVCAQHLGCERYGKGGGLSGMTLVGLDRDPDPCSCGNGARMCEWTARSWAWTSRPPASSPTGSAATSACCLMAARNLPAPSSSTGGRSPDFSVWMWSDAA